VRVVALLGPADERLAAGLLQHGVDVRRLAADTPGVLRLLESRLRRRRYEDRLTSLPLLELALRQGDFDVVHAFDPATALAAARWRRRTGRPSVFTLPGVPDFAWIRARRRRRELLVSAIAGCSATTAPSEAAAVALRWWLGAEARVIAPDSVERHLALYAELRRGPAY
jgi:hypothetical protein